MASLRASRIFFIPLLCAWYSTWCRYAVHDLPHLKSCATFCFCLFWFPLLISNYPRAFLCLTCVTMDSQAFLGFRCIGPEYHDSRNHYSIIEIQDTQLESVQLLLSCLVCDASLIQPLWSSTVCLFILDKYSIYLLFAYLPCLLVMQINSLSLIFIYILLWSAPINPWIMD